MSSCINYIHTGIPYLGIVSAGFSSPLDEEHMDLMYIEDYVVRDKNSSFLLRVEGDHLKEQGICDGDTVVFERGVTPTMHQLSVVYVDGEGYRLLFPADIPKEHLGGRFEIIGIVISIIRRYVP